MTEAVYHFSAFSAGHACAECGAVATGYVHGVGMRCGDCHEAAPESRREGVGGGDSDE